MISFIKLLKAKKTLLTNYIFKTNFYPNIFLGTARLGNRKLNNKRREYIKFISFIFLLSLYITSLRRERIKLILKRILIIALLKEIKIKIIRSLLILRKKKSNLS